MFSFSWGKKKKKKRKKEKRENFRCGFVVVLARDFRSEGNPHEKL